MTALVGQDLNLQRLITEALSNTCCKYFSGFKTNLTIAGTIGITVDNSRVCIVQISDDLRPDLSHRTKRICDQPLDRRPGACATQQVHVAAPSDSGILMTNNTIVIEPAKTKKHKQTVQSWNNTQSGSLHTGFPAPARNTRHLIPENSSLLSLLTTGTKPEDMMVTAEKPLPVAACGSTKKVQVPSRDPLPVHCSDAALDLCTGPERAMKVVSDKVHGPSPSTAMAGQSRVPSLTDSNNGTGDTSCTNNIDGNATQFLQKLMKGVTEETTGTSSRPTHLNDISFGSAAKRVKLEVVETPAKLCNSLHPNAAHVTTSLPNVRSECTESILTSATAGSKTARDEVATKSCITQAPITVKKTVVMAEQDEGGDKNSSAFVDMESVVSAHPVVSALPVVKSESAKAEAHVLSTGRNCRSEKSEIDLTTGTTMTMNDLVDFYIRKEIFHNRK